MCCFRSDDDDDDDDDDDGASNHGIMTRAANPKRNVVDRATGMVSRTTTAAASSTVVVPVPPMYLTNEKFVPYNAAAPINSDRDARTPPRSPLPSSFFGSEDDTVGIPIDLGIRRGSDDDSNDDGVGL